MTGFEIVSQALFLQLLQTLQEFTRTPPPDWCDQGKQKQIDRTYLIDTSALQHFSMN